MKTLLGCRINGMELGDIDERVAVTDIREDGPALATLTCGNAKYGGTRLTRQTRQRLTVEIALTILERNPARRAEVADKIAAWCQDGYLTVSYRPGQRLGCVCVARPGLGSAMKWASELTIRYAALGLPWWEDELPTTARISQPSREGRTVLSPAGTADWTLAEAAVTNRSGATVNEMDIACGETHMRFTGLGLADGETLSAAYDREGLLRLRISGAGAERSAMAMRTADSSDDLIARQRQANVIRLTADGAVTGRFQARGRYV